MYAARGWGIHDYNTVAQCANEGLVTKMQLVKGEGCRYYGYLLVCFGGERGEGGGGERREKKPISFLLLFFIIYI